MSLEEAHHLQRLHLQVLTGIDIILLPYKARQRYIKIIFHAFLKYLAF